MIPSIPGMKAPDFAGVCMSSDGKHSDVSLEDLLAKNQWLVLFFYPMDFGYIATSELLELSDIKVQLEELNCNVIACSTDSAVVHEKILTIPAHLCGVQGIKYPLLEDPNGKIAENYGVLREGSGYTFRAYFIIDNKGVIRARTVGDLPVGLDIAEIVQKVKGLQTSVDQETWYNKEMEDQMRADDIHFPYNS